MSSERRRLLLSADSNGDGLEEKRGSLSPGEDLSVYWEEMRRIDDHVREISDTRDSPRESKWPLLRRKSMSHALVSQVSSTILESAKSDVSSIMEMMKNPDRFSYSSEESRSLNVFEVPKTKESLTIIEEEEEEESQQVRGKKMVTSKAPLSIKEEHLSLLKEIREQIDVMQSEMRSLRSELHQTKPVLSHHLKEDPALNSVHEVTNHLKFFVRDGLSKYDQSL